MKHTIIIAEAGVNHNGDIELAKQLIDQAHNAGVDYVKFQTFKASNIVSKEAQKANYQKNQTDANESQWQMLKRLELNEESHDILMKYCETKPIHFLSTPFDLESIDLLKKIGIKLGKIPSGEITNLPYLRKMAQTFEQIILSTGMANMQEIEDAIKVLLASGTHKDHITVLHCNTEYPTPMIDVNLHAMNTIQQAFGVKVGYSDHTNGIEVPIAAVALGASVIEKHFTLDKNMEGPDHQASLEPEELKAMVDAIRNIEIAIAGTGIKETTDSERKNITIARKSILAAKDIKKGEIFDEKNLIVKRPGNGISPMLWDEIIGKVAVRDFQTDELIEL
ncbi:MAG: N-acetylneuraminate synthase [Pseudarcicella sp.]|nr:N-acetylneuraminate synthase [Pseudarcicella sp.]MBP6410173.1 N-acetylneuraminate synthase [Pseudarcicella sp.]